MTTTCTDCHQPIPAGLATIRTTLVGGVPAPVAWCRDCRPVVPESELAPAIPVQRRGGTLAQRLAEVQR